MCLSRFYLLRVCVFGVHIHTLIFLSIIQNHCSWYLFILQEDGNILKKHNSIDTHENDLGHIMPVIITFYSE